MCCVLDGLVATRPYPTLTEIDGALNQIQNKYAIQIKIIANSRPANLGVAFRFEAWDKQREIDQLLDIDIGIMPLPDKEVGPRKVCFQSASISKFGDSVYCFTCWCQQKRLCFQI